MSFKEMLSFVDSIPILIFIGIVGFITYVYIKDKYQKQHAIIRTHPILGRLRYLLEHLGEPLRQYLFMNNTENKPIDRNTQSTIAKAGKYGSTISGFGSIKDQSQPDFHLNNDLFPKNVDELAVNNEDDIDTMKYKIKHEGEFHRDEELIKSTMKPWRLKEPIVIGPNTEKPWIKDGFVGVSAMSYGALSDVAVQALIQGVAISGSSWLNTGEGGISSHHLTKVYQVNKKITNVLSDEYFKIHNDVFNFIEKKEIVSNVELKKEFGNKYLESIKFLVKKEFVIEKGADLIFQIGSGLFGARKKGLSEPEFSPEEFVKNASRPEVKAIEIKMAQGAKTKGGHVEAAKVTPEIAEIRGVEPHKTIESPNRFRQFNDIDSLFKFIKTLKELSKKPVGIKVVVGSQNAFDPIASAMLVKGFGPDFITVDGGEGGTGATYQEMADSVGLPIYSAIQIVNESLINYSVRDRVKIFASGMLATADKMAIAMSLGADLINVARPAMNTIGCINAMKCHTNRCPAGVTTHNPKLKQGLVVEEKRFRTANYLATMRSGVFSLAAACGVDSPTKLERKHATFKHRDYTVKNTF